jgi:glycerol-3-phosphate acyltransferase PlsY
MELSLILAGYLVGTIPFALLVPRRVAGIDVRYAGSGNLGAANVFRTAGRSIGLTVLALDISKGCAAVIAAGSLGADEATRAATGVAAVIGHIYPVWLRFRGGKGVATACGVFSVLAPLATALAASVFVIVVWATRYMSLGSIVASLTFAPLVYLTNAPEPFIASAVVVAGLILFGHRSNLARLRAGTERRFGERVSG